MQIIYHCDIKSITCDLANLTFIMVIMETVVQEMAISVLLVILLTSQAPYTLHYPGGFSKCTSHFELFLTKTGSEKSHGYRDVIIFENLIFENVSFHTETKTRCFFIPPV